MSETSETGYPAVKFVSRMSVRAWETISPFLPDRLLSAITAFLKLIRPGRVVMITSLTWVCASVADVPFFKHLLITISGMFLAMAGFAIDIYSDRESDQKSPRPWPVNPISAGLMETKTAGRWIFFFLLAGVAFAAGAHPLTLLPASVLLFIYYGLSVGFLDGPIGRAVTLGLLQAIYVVLAAAASGKIAPFVLLVAAVFFTAMFGARAIVDIRDLPNDALTDTRTLVKVYGIRITSWILPVMITISFMISLSLYTSGIFDRDYLILTLISFIPGILLAWSFPLFPTPNYAFILSVPYWCIGIFYMAALFLGSR